MTALRYLDLVLLALALPVFLLADAPVLGWVAGAGAWAIWRGVGEITDRRAAAATTPQRVAGIAAGSMMGRGWVLILILLAVGLAAGEDVGLAAAVLALILYTVHFATKLALRSETAGAPTT